MGFRAAAGSERRIQGAALGDHVVRCFASRLSCQGPRKSLGQWWKWCLTGRRSNEGNNRFHGSFVDIQLANIHTNQTLHPYTDQMTHCEGASLPHLQNPNKKHQKIEAAAYPDRTGDL